MKASRDMNPRCGDAAGAEAAPGDGADGIGLGVGVGLDVGVGGEVRLKLFGEGFASLKPHKSFNNGALTVTSLRDDGKGGAIARFAEVTDRTAAEKLRSTTLTVPRSALPPLAEGEYYYTDLIGLTAVSTSGEAIGTCVAVENFGAGGFRYGDPPAGSGKTGRAVAVGSSPLGAVARSSRRTFKVVGPYLEKQLPTAWPRRFRAIRMRTHRAACKLSLGSAQ